jgi:hypothetical protein
VHPDDDRIAALIRMIRHELRLTQQQLANTARVPLRDVKLVESGRAADVNVGRLRAIIQAQDGRLRLTGWWHGAAADQLLDRRHAALVERVVALLKARGWMAYVEVSFSEFGERGSIDVLALRPRDFVALVIEVKTTIGSLEETNRVFDAKIRLAPAIVVKRFGWRPRTVACALVLPDESTVRRIVQRHAATMDSLYPARSREVRRWLRRPDRPLRGIWFLSNGRDRTAVRQ